MHHRHSKTNETFEAYIDRLELENKKESKKGSSGTMKNIINILNSFIEKNQPVKFRVHLKKIQTELIKKNPLLEYDSKFYHYLSSVKKNNKKNKKIVESINSFQADYKEIFFVDMLTSAATKNNIKLIQNLLKDQNKIDNKNSDGETALTIAADKNYLILTQMLLENKADIHKTNNYEETPLKKAMNKSNFSVIALLLINNAKISGFPIFSKSIRKFRANVIETPDNIEQFSDVFSTFPIVRKQANELMRIHDGNHNDNAYTMLVSDLDSEQNEIEALFKKFEKIYLDKLDKNIGRWCPLVILKMITGYLGLFKPTVGNYHFFQPHSKKRKFKNTNPDLQISSKKSQKFLRK
jgi:hypothetical protein